MNLNDIKQLIEIVNGSDLQETIIEEGNFKLILRRTNANVPSQVIAVQPTPALAQTATPVTQSSVVTSAPILATSAPKSSEPVTDGFLCRSPIVGTFYQAASPDTPPFVSLNDSIKKGDVLCIIEAMKLMNEIEAEVSGTIVEILVENGQAVEYDQPLFRIKP